MLFILWLKREILALKSDEDEKPFFSKVTDAELVKIDARIRFSNMHEKTFSLLL